MKERMKKAERIKDCIQVFEFSKSAQEFRELSGEAIVRHPTETSVQESCSPIYLIQS